MTTATAYSLLAADRMIKSGQLHVTPRRGQPCEPATGQYLLIDARGMILEVCDRVSGTFGAKVYHVSYDRLVEVAYL